MSEFINDVAGECTWGAEDKVGGFQSRCCISVCMLLERLSIKDVGTGEYKLLELKDTSIYIKEMSLKAARLQIFNNWSPFMVNDPHTTWMGIEYFCGRADDLWSLTDEQMKQLAMEELESLGLATASSLLDATLVKVENYLFFL